MDMRESINGILIHQLPKEYKTDALNKFSNLSCPTTKHDKMGLRIYFKQYRAAQESIMNKNVLVRGILYNVYSLVTNLTFHGIRPYAKKYTIRTLFKNFGSVIDLYEIQENYNDINPLITDDYRIILDIPEVMANFDLTPLTLSGVDCQFPISFFCRLCRQNGHKQHQCLNVLRETSPSRQMSYNTSRRIDTVQRQDVVHGIDRTLKNKVLKTIPEKFKFERKKVLEPERKLKSIKTDKELAKCARKNEKCESYHKTSSNSYNRDSSYLKPKHFRNESVSCHNNLKPVEQTASIIGGVPFLRNSMLLKDNESNNVSKPSGESSRCYRDTHDFRKVSFHERKSKDTSTAGCASIATDSSSGARISRSRKRMGPSISRILPPDMKVEDVHKIIIKANSLGSQNLPFHIKERLTYILNWNMENPLPNTRQQESKLLQVIQMLLNKSSRDKKEERPTGCCYNDSASSSKSDPASRTKSNQAASSKSDPASSIKSDPASSIKSDPASSIKSDPASSIKSDPASSIKSDPASSIKSDPASSIKSNQASSIKSDLASSIKSDLAASIKSDPASSIKSDPASSIKSDPATSIKSDPAPSSKSDLAASIKSDPTSSSKSDLVSSIGERKDLQSTASIGLSPKIHSRRTSISQGVIELIDKVAGELKPKLLTNFLMQVRGRRNVLEIVKHFTKDKDALVAQLKNVVSIYYRSGKKGAGEEQDIRWIQNLCSRLEVKTESSTNLDDIQHASGSSKFQGRQTIISPSIKDAIWEVDGELKPAELFNFLVHVRGRRNFSDVVRNFTKDNSVLVDQLEQVISSYYRSGQKDAVSEQNVQWIKGVCQRLLHVKGTSASATDLLIKTENSFDMLPKVEPTIQDVFMKSDPFICRSFIKTEPMDE